MKKIISFVLSVNLFSISFLTASCDWKKPPLNTEQLNHIFNIAKTQVFDGYIDDIPLFNKDENFILPWNYDPENQSSETARIWSDNITNLFGNKLSNEKDGYFNKGLNLIDGQFDQSYMSNDLDISLEKLELLKSYYFSIRLNDIKSVDKNLWLSEYEERNIKIPVVINNENYDIDPLNKPKNSSISGENKYSALDINMIWGLGSDKMKSTSYIVRFLFSFSPSVKFNLSPTLFYIDVEMNK
ncbi:hypothetical protein [Spiroplasma turonicum]|uniref:Lipoprotein n=1 Tax=Spiroplasma turonicum TaxID=216946 RepID=A0A0K1P6J3_9MOLU|nr:hypothetical protein [Spiroplasma turonicum]AKU79941.1 hypothetical protein STURON_00695 [Spiroplasma turonicum]ALX70954.1 hypothetical protein STURO_v1c06950 [Spiroplasma turonicum]